MPTPEITTPPAESAPPPPSSVKSAAQPISQADLARELGNRPPPSAPQPKAEPVTPPVEAPSPDKPSSFRESMDKAMAAKKAEAISKDDAPPPKAPKAEKKVEATPPKADVPPTKDEPVPAEHLRVLPTDKPDTAKRIKAILAERDAARDEAKTAKADYEAAKKAPSTPPEELAKLKADYDAAQNDLLRYRRLHDIDSDVEFKAKYKEPVAQIEKNIEESFKKHGLTEDFIKGIRDAGGFAAWSESGKAYVENVPDLDNPGATKQVTRTAAQLLHGWLNSGAINPVDAEAIKASLGRQSLLRSEEKAAIAKAQDEARSYYENQSKGQREAMEKAQQGQAGMAKEYEEFAKKVESETEWLKDREIPADASAETRKEIEEHNTFNKQLRDGLKKHPTTAAEYGQLKLEAVESHHLRREKGRLEARVTELEGELKKTRAATRTTSKAGSLMTAPAKTAEAQDDKLPPTDWRSRLDAKMKAGQGGDE